MTTRTLSLLLAVTLAGCVAEPTAPDPYGGALAVTPATAVLSDLPGVAVTDGYCEKPPTEEGWREFEECMTRLLDNPPEGPFGWVCNASRHPQSGYYLGWCFYGPEELPEFVTPTCGQPPEHLPIWWVCVLDNIGTVEPRWCRLVPPRIEEMLPVYRAYCYDGFPPPRGS